ncbi:hypothetical protein FQR65_LT05538 [Abscondita terminalis]|nr:hypothetical protein FQR65_LT05538 [Abscondita terminalis]
MQLNEIIPLKMLSGRTIPSIGLGTYLIKGRRCKDIINEALSLGYRAFDTAAMYDNECDLGNALKELLPKHNLQRKDIFITTKLYPSDHGARTTGAIKTSLKNLQLDYIDLYLIHWPGVYGVSHNSKDNLRLRTESWEAMVKAQEQLLIKDIGVSNYTVTHLKQLLDNCYGVKPVINQVEWHPSCHQPELKDFCDKENIILQAYMPLGGNGNSRLLQHRIIRGVSERLNKTPAQVLLRWCLQQNVAIIPKASSREHLKENLQLNFVIPESEMVAIGKISPEKYDWDPSGIA